MEHHQPYFYILKEKQAVPVAGLEEWARAGGVRHIATDKIGGAYVSTIFLGINHRHSGNGPPILFETATFLGGRIAEQTRSSTWEEAEKQHAAAVERVQREIKENVNE